MIIAIDFDGTCTTHRFPGVGKDIGAAPVLKKLVDKGHQLILYTMRSDMPDPKPSDPTVSSAKGKHLTAALNWFKKNEVKLYGVQTNPTQLEWTTSPKCYAQLYIDDAALGCPLIYEEGERPYVDWVAVEQMLIMKGIIH